MAHEIEQFDNGKAAIALARVPGWHRLGTVTKEAMTADEALNLAFLSGWNVRKVPVMGLDDGPECTECHHRLGDLHDEMCQVGDHEGMDDTRLVVADDTSVPVAMNGFWGTVRTHPVSGQPEGLGVVGDDYHPIQNEQLAEMLMAIVDESGAVFETAGSLRGGTEVFMTLKLPEGIKVDGDDVMDHYLIGCNAHDGRRALEVVTDMTRVVCANTQAIALRNYRSRHSIRHVIGATERIQEAREALKLTFKVAEEFQKEAEAMIKKQLAVKAFEDVCREIWPKPKETATYFQKELDDRRMGELLGLFKGADTQANARKTRWGGLQAIIEYVDHFSPVGDKETPDRARAEKALFGKGREQKEQAFKLLQVV